MTDRYWDVGGGVYSGGPWENYYGPFDLGGPSAPREGSGGEPVEYGGTGGRPPPPIAGPGPAPAPVPELPTVYVTGERVPRLPDVLVTAGPLGSEAVDFVYKRKLKAWCNKNPARCYRGEPLSPVPLPDIIYGTEYGEQPRPGAKERKVPSFPNVPSSDAYMDDPEPEWGEPMGRGGPDRGLVPPQLPPILWGIGRLIIRELLREVIKPKPKPPKMPDYPPAPVLLPEDPKLGDIVEQDLIAQPQVQTLPEVVVSPRTAPGRLPDARPLPQPGPVPVIAPGRFPTPTVSPIGQPRRAPARMPSSTPGTSPATAPGATPFPWSEFAPYFALPFFARAGRTLRPRLTPSQSPGVGSQPQPQPFAQQSGTRRGTEECCACRGPRKKRRKRRECVKSVIRDTITGLFARK